MNSLNSSPIHPSPSYLVGIEAGSPVLVPLDPPTGGPAGGIGRSIVTQDPTTGGLASPVASAPCRLVTDGNSLTDLAGKPVTTTLGPVPDSSWVPWAMALTEQRMRWVQNVAVTGQSIAQRTADLPNWVPTSSANVLAFLEGTNSISLYVIAGMTEQQAAAAAIVDLDAYLAAVRGYGKFQTIFLGTCPPRGVVAARNAAHDAFNRAVRDRCSTQQGLVLLDFWAVTVDPASATLSARANFLRSSDTLHPTPRGSRAMGAAAAAVFNRLQLPANSLVPSSMINRSMSTLAMQINSNPTFSSPDTGTLIGSATGTVRAGWRAGISGGTATAVASVVASAASGVGSAQRLTVTGASSGATVAIAIATTEALPYSAANDYFRAIASLSWTNAANVSAIEVRIGTQTDASYTSSGFFTTAATATVADYDQANMAVPFVVSGPATRFPNGAPNSLLTISIVVIFGAASGSITLDVDRATLINLGQNVVDF